MTTLLNQARVAARATLAEHNITLPRGATDEMVRAVIKAMRQPTEAMVLAGTSPEGIAPYPCTDTQVRGKNFSAVLAGSWQLMIDAALAE